MLELKLAESNPLTGALKFEVPNGEGGKPKGMHWRTFERLHAEHNDFVNASLAGMMRKFGRLGVGLDDLLDDR